MASVIYRWSDFEEDISTDAIPDKYIITITQDGEEIATIVHRTCGGVYPLNGEVAKKKEYIAHRIVRALTETDPDGVL